MRTCILITTLTLLLSSIQSSQADELAESPRVAAIQLLHGTSLQEAISLVQDAGEAQADIVLLPMKYSPQLPQPATGAIFQAMAPLAIQYRMIVVSPISEIENGKVYNSALVIDPAGNLSGVYRQTHLSPADRLAGIQAGNELPVFDTLYGRIGVLLDQDILFREAARVLTLKGATLLLYAYPGSWDDAAHPDTRLSEAAFYDGYYVAMAGLTGPGSKRASAVLNLNGDPLTPECSGSCVVSAKVNLADITPACFWQGPREMLFACRDTYAFTELVKEVTRTVNPNLESLHVACIQMVSSTYEHKLDVVRRAGELGADVVLTQEAYFPNPDHLSIEDATGIPSIIALQKIASEFDMTIIAGISLGVQRHANIFRSSYAIIGPDGKVAGAHHQHTGYPSDDFELFDTGFGPFGALVCWDLSVIGPEGTRVEALKGARIIFFGTLTITPELYNYSLPGLAMGSVVPIAFSAASNNTFINPQAGVVGADGVHLLGTYNPDEFGKEIIMTVVPLSLTSDLYALKQRIWNERRPPLYTPLIENDISLPGFDASYIPKEPVAGLPVLFSASTYNTIFPMNADYDVRFLVDGQPYDSPHRIKYERWSSYPTGAWDFNYRFLCSQFLWTAVPGVHTLKIEADANGEVLELREDNNRLEWVISVPEVNIPTPTPQPPPTVGEYPQLPSPWQYLGYFYDPLLDNGKKQTNNFIDRQDLLPDAPGMELIHAGHHVGTHVVVQFRRPDGTWDWHPAVYPDKESMPDYPPVADRFSATSLVRDPEVPGAYVSGYQRSDPLGTHGLCYFSPKTTNQTGDSPYEGHPLLSMTCEDGVCGDPVCIDGFWNVPSFFERNGRACMLALPSGYLEGQTANLEGTTYAVILERDHDTTWASVPTNEYQFIWVQSGPIWIPLYWDPFVMLGRPVIQGVNAGTQVQACVFDVEESQYLLLAGGATLHSDDWGNSTSRGFILLYRFLDDPAPGPRMDYRVELIQTVVDSQNALPGSPAMVGGYTAGSLVPLKIRLGDATGPVPDYVVGVVRRHEDDPDRWKQDFDTGVPQNVSGGFIILRGFLEGGQPRFDIVPPYPGEHDYISGYGIEVLPADQGDDVLFKTSIDESFIVLRVPNETGEFFLDHAEVLLDGRHIAPSAVWKPHFFSACFLGLETSEELERALDLVIGFSLEDRSDPTHLRHGYIVRPNVNDVLTPTPSPSMTLTATPTYSFTKTFTQQPTPTKTEIPTPSTSPTRTCTPTATESPSDVSEWKVY